MSMIPDWLTFQVVHNPPPALEDFSFNKAVVQLELVEAVPTEE